MPIIDPVLHAAHPQRRAMRKTNREMGERLD